MNEGFSSSHRRDGSAVVVLSCKQEKQHPIFAYGKTNGGRRNECKKKKPGKRTVEAYFNTALLTVCASASRFPMGSPRHSSWSTPSLFTPRSKSGSGLSTETGLKMRVQYWISELSVAVRGDKRGFCSFSFKLSEREKGIRNTRVEVHVRRSTSLLRHYSLP